MAKGLRENWKNTGVGLGHAFRDLGKTLLRTGTHAARKVNEWASDEEEEQPVQQEKEAPKEEE